MNTSTDMAGPLSDNTKHQSTRRSTSYPIRLVSIIPPPNFGAVQNGKVFRSGFPQPGNLDFMAGMNLKTILCLVDTENATECSNFIDDNRIKRIRIDISPNKDGVVRSAIESIYQALLVIMDATNYPLLIHCNQGRHRTGCVIACLRRMQNWPIQAVLEEYETYANPKIREGDLKLIRDVFDPDKMLKHCRNHVQFDSRPSLMKLLHSDLVGVDFLVKILASTDGVSRSHESVKSVNSSKADSGIDIGMDLGDVYLSQKPIDDLSGNDGIETYIKECDPLSPSY